MSAKQKQMAFLERCYPINERFEVRVMATAEGWAMVRRNGAMPFICRESELEFEDKPSEAVQ